jgi:phospholipase A1/A2
VREPRSTDARTHRTDPPNMPLPNYARSCIPFAAFVAASYALPTYAQLSTCVNIPEPAARLACYDAAAGREGAGSRAVPAPDVAGAPPAVGPQTAKPSFLEERWEVGAGEKRGILNLRPHRPIYGLIHWTSDKNDRPSSPTRPFDLSEPVDLDSIEGKIQLSFKTKVAEGLLGTRSDLWFGYSQVSYWQVGNRDQSSPFRETNYEPEATWIVPVDWSLGGLRMRFLGLTLNHQSNGQGGSLSRSWNRLIGEAAAEYGPWSFHVRPWTRVFSSSGEQNDNPDIKDFIGRGELVVAWRRDGHVVTATGRHTLRGDERSRGSLRLDWAFPLAGSLNGHVQVFSGYGLNLIDYNHRQTTIGLGFSFLD